MSRPIRRSADLAHVSLRHFIVVPLLVVIALLTAVLLPTASAAQAPSGVEQERAYAAAQAEYEVGHYTVAFTGFAALADVGHADSARIALQMQRYGSGLYQMRFAARPQQIGRWTALLSCRNLVVAGTEACASVARAEASPRR